MITTQRLRAFPLFLGLSLTLAPVMGQVVDAPEKEKTQEQKASELPAPTELIKRYLEVSGGEQAYRAISAMTFKGDLLIPAAGIQAPLTIYSAAPNKTLVKINIPGMGETTEGFNGEVAWSLSPMQGPSLKEGKALAQAKEGSDFYADLNFAKRHKVMETLALTEFAGESSYKVRLVNQLDDESFAFFSQESGLKIGSMTTAESPMGPLKITIILSQFKVFQGLKIPMKMIQDMGTMQQTFSFKEVSFEALEDSLFALPPEIQTLLEDEPAEGAEGAEGAEEGDESKEF